jgi:GH24 family phage-related lysozyme (muramidase)
MYNIGSKALADSTVLKRIKTSTGDIDAAWMMWNKARVNGKLTEIAGLTNRRKKELQLFNQKNQI